MIEQGLAGYGLVRFGLPRLVLLWFGKEKVWTLIKIEVVNVNIVV